MPYERPDMSALKEQFAALTERLQNAPDYPSFLPILSRKWVSLS